MKEGSTTHKGRGAKDINKFNFKFKMKFDKAKQCKMVVSSLRFGGAPPSFLGGCCFSIHLFCRASFPTFVVVLLPFPSPRPSWVVLHDLLLLVVVSFHLLFGWCCFHPFPLWVVMPFSLFSKK